MCVCVCVGGGGVEMLISEITGSIIAYPVPHTHFFILNIMVSTTQTLPQIKSHEIIGDIKQHFMSTSPLTYVKKGIQDFVKCCIKSWVHLDIRPNNMLFGGLQLKTHTKLV